MRIRHAGIAIALALVLVTAATGEDPKSADKKAGDTKSGSVGKAASKLSAGALAGEFVTKAMQEWFGSGGTPPLPTHPEPPKQPPAPAAAGAVIKDWDGLFEVTLPANFPLPTRAHRILDDGVTQFYSYTSEHNGDACTVAFAYYDQDRFTADNLTEQLDEMRDAMLAETSSTLLHEEKTDKFNLPARLMRIRSEQDPATPYYGIVLTVAKARFVYKIIYVTPNASNLDAEAVHQYFNSLKWLPSFY